MMSFALSWVSVSASRTFTPARSRKTPVGWIPTFLSASSTRPRTVESTFIVARAGDTCTAGASPKKFGSVYRAPSTSATPMVT